MRECIDMAAADYEILTSLLDARFICGASPLYTEMRDELRKKILVGKSAGIITWLHEQNEKRHRHFGDSSYLIEPNLKEGQGGLRDYHTMLWIGKIKYGINQPRDLEYEGHLSHSEYLELQQALSFIWNVRNKLHQLTRRKCDQLHIEFRQELARAFRFSGGNGQKPVERFLGELHGHMELIKFRYLVFSHEIGSSKTSRRGRKAVRTLQIPGLEIRRDTLAFVSPEKILEFPRLLIHIFEESARLKIPLGPEAQRLVKEFGHLVDREFRSDPEVVKAFERILLIPAPVFDVLNSMLMTGFLTRFIPAFKNLVSRIQYNEYHIYSVDKHSLRAVQTLKGFGMATDGKVDPLARSLFRRLKKRKLLIWATLLHDIGKGRPERHHSITGAEIAENLLRELHYPEEDVAAVTGLIRNHLLLMKVATRRDLNDEETAISCALKVKSVEHLKMLYLLTVADAMATGPKAWNDWSSVLLRELFLKTLNILEKGELASARALNIIASKKTEILNAFSTPREKDYVENLLAKMSPRYLLYIPTRMILEHVALYRRIGDRPFVWDIRKANGSETRTIIICTKDRPGLFSKIAGVLTLNGVDILDAQIFTWKNNIALDIFEVKPPPDLIFEEERWQKAEYQLTAALAGELDVGAALENRLNRYRKQKPRIWETPHRVAVDNETSSFFTIVEVFTYNFPGLLFSITDALFRCGLDIWVAKIATRVDQVVDVFYVRDMHGQKITDPNTVADIESAILGIVPGPE